ncbi:hypothetical protein LIER_13894 [Lithospermum erythrorhizon]|uniref:Uncharacterized protein n=1 Tax=Lithospermum erythrorhizon TaxID=34254 RepID=A0AAV3Q099_LITER
MGCQECRGGRMGSWSYLVWIVHGPIVGVDGSPRVPSSEIPGEEDQVGPCAQVDALFPFNPLSEMRQRKGRKIHELIPSSPPRDVCTKTVNPSACNNILRSTPGAVQARDVTGLAFAAITKARVLSNSAQALAIPR